MAKRIPPQWHGALQKIFHLQSERDDAVDELNALLLQISLAVMLIFMIAFFIFMSKVDGELSRVDELKEKIAEAEKNEIVHAVETVAEQYRIRYGLKAFLVIDPLSGRKGYDFAGVVDGDTLTHSGGAQRSFRLGAAAAQRDYSDRSALTAEWRRRVNEIAGTAAKRTPAFLEEQLTEAIRRLRREVVEVQTLAAAAIQHHYATHPEAVRDEKIQGLLRRIEAAPDEESRRLPVAELSRQLRTYVYRRLAAECGVGMLIQEEP